MGNAQANQTGDQPWHAAVLLMVPGPSKLMLSRPMHRCPLPLHLQEMAAALKAAEQQGRQQHAKEQAEAQLAAAAAALDRAAEVDVLTQRCGEAEKALAAILKAANSGLKAAGGAKEEAKALAQALRSGSSNGSCGAENAPGAGGAAAGRHLRQSAGGKQWR